MDSLPKTAVLASQNDVINATEKDSKITKCNTAILIGVVVAISLIAIALFYAEVKWGLLSAGLTWTLSNPLVGIAVTLLVIGGISYAIYRYLNTSLLKVKDNNALSLGNVTIEDVEGRLASIHQEYLANKAYYENLTEGGVDEENWGQITAREDLIKVEVKLTRVVTELNTVLNATTSGEGEHARIMSRYPYDSQNFLSLRYPNNSYTIASNS